MQDVDERAFEDAVDSSEVLMTGYERLEWVTDSKIVGECDTAMKRAKAIVDDSDDDVMWFDVYGSDWIKKTGASFSIPPTLYPS